MPIVVLTHWTQKFNTTGDQAFLGITMMLVGVSLVFLVLVLLSLIVGLMSKTISNKRKSKLENTGPEIMPADKIGARQNEITPSTDISTEGVQDPAIIAVIAAAVNAMLSGKTTTEAKAGFRVRRIRRV